MQSEERSKILMNEEKYADVLSDWLLELGYTTCFFVAGGNSMHLLASMRTRFHCVAVVHEVTAGLAAEYFNEHSDGEKAFVLVTAGPGLTNVLTAIAGSWLESRELLVIGGQVKSTDLAGPGMRQRGIQEVDGVALCRPICKAVARIEQPVSRSNVESLVMTSRNGRKGPVFIEVCLDVQGAPVDRSILEDDHVGVYEIPKIVDSDFAKVRELIQSSQRPVLLLGGGINREIASQVRAQLDDLGIPILTSWNGADRYASDRPMWFGRPDTWGMRGANLVMQQADLLVVLAARLSLQQTGFNWQKFVPNGKVIHIDLDPSETRKGHPATDVALNVDANDVLEKISMLPKVSRPDWIALCQKIKEECPLADPQNSIHSDFYDPYKFVMRLSELCTPDDAIVPCSSGGANTVMMQAFLNKTGQVFFNDKALAAMGYGLGGAIGAAIASNGRRTVLVEGDGGFVQNLQDLATVAVRALNLKMFVFANEGYASIRMTQRNYFGGDYLGCDTSTGLGFPDWATLADAYGIQAMTLSGHFEDNEEFVDLWDSNQPVLYVVPIHPEQTYFPKISSRVLPSGGMESSPLDDMSPELSLAQKKVVAPFI